MEHISQCETSDDGFEVQLDAEQSPSTGNTLPNSSVTQPGRIISYKLHCQIKISQ